jgi:hypothetical protein
VCLECDVAVVNFNMFNSEVCFSLPCNSITLANKIN